LAVFFAAVKRPGEAEPYLKAAAEGGGPSAVLQLADYYVGLRRLDDAAAVLAPLTKIQAQAGAAQVRLAQIAYAKNDKAQAHTLIDSVITREPNNLQALLIKSRWLANEGKMQDAMARAQTAVKASPNSA